MRILHFIRTIYELTWFNLIFLARYLTAFYRKYPDFIIIGVQKGGTSSLHAYLCQHPDIQASFRKEVHFFDLFYKRGKHWYRSFFPLRNTKKVTGEATPFYIFHPLVPKRMKKLLPDIKIIVMLRNPVERAYSHFQMERNKDLETEADFEKAVQQEFKEIQQNEEDYPYHKKAQTKKRMVRSYIARGYYYEQLSKWLEHYPSGNFLILSSEDFFQRPYEILQKVYTFMGVRKIFPESLSVMNKGDYLKLSETKTARLQSYFEEDQLKLRNMLKEVFDSNPDQI